MKTKIFACLFSMLILGTNLLLLVHAESNDSEYETLSELAKKADLFCYAINHPCQLYTAPDEDNMIAWKAATFIGDEQNLYPFYLYGEDYDYSQQPATLKSQAKQLGVADGWLLAQPQIIAYSDRYITNHHISLPVVYGHFYYSLPDSVQTKEDMLKCSRKYFTNDYNVAVSNLGIIDGKAYLGDDPGLEIESEPAWETLSVQSIDNHSATLTLDIVLDAGYGDPLENLGNYTITYKNTADGWKISGGTYFDFKYFGKAVPPQTGDSTAVYLTSSLLSLGVLTATVSVTVRKRKKCFKI